MNRTVGYSYAATGRSFVCILPKCINSHSSLRLVHNLLLHGLGLNLLTLSQVNLLLLDGLGLLRHNLLRLRLDHLLCSVDWGVHVRDRSEVLGHHLCRLRPHRSLNHSVCGSLWHVKGLSQVLLSKLLLGVLRHGLSLRELSHLYLRYWVRIHLLGSLLT